MTDSTTLHFNLNDEPINTVLCVSDHCEEFRVNQNENNSNPSTEDSIEECQNQSKKCKVNSGSSQSPTSVSKIRLSTSHEENHDSNIELKDNFPAIPEVEENRTPSQGSTPKNKTTPLHFRTSFTTLEGNLDNLDTERPELVSVTMPIVQETEEKSSSSKSSPKSLRDTADDLKRRLEGDFPNLAESMALPPNPFRPGLKSIENMHTSIYAQTPPKSPSDTKKSQRKEIATQNCKANTGKNSKLKMKELAKEKEHLFRSKWKEPSDVIDSNTPNKKKVIFNNTRGGSQSVSKFMPSQSLVSWSNKKNDLNQGPPAAPESYQFKAKPMPRFVPFEAKKSDRLCVIPQEFHLMTEERGRIRGENLKRSFEERERISQTSKKFKITPSQYHEKFINESNNYYNDFMTQQRNGASRSVSKTDFMRNFDSNNFKALPMPDFSKPFKPKSGIAPLTDPENFVLNTEARAKRREDFDYYLKARELLRDQRKHQEEEEKRIEEQKEIAEIRKTMVFKARPYNPSSAFKVVRNSETVPSSPQSGTKMAVEKMN